MTAPNATTLWARAIAEELAAADIETIVIAPGSRSTPLTLAVADHPDLEPISLIDERSAAYFALGHARITGHPTPVVTTSGTAAANLHPAVLEADAGRVPMLLLTADRPPALQDSGANQTVDQTKLYGDTVRWFRDPGLPEADARALRSLRTAIARAVAHATQPPAGPVHINLPFRKPLEPVDVPGEVPAEFADTHPTAATGRTDGHVTLHGSRSEPDPAAVTSIAEATSAADRPLIVCGPASPDDSLDASTVSQLAEAAGAPIIADPLSGLRFHPVTDDTPVIAHADAYLTPRVTDDWPDPDIVVRFGASPTSKVLRQYLARTDARQVLVDPAADWREATFRATDRLGGSSNRVATALRNHIEADPTPAWVARWVEADERARDRVSNATRGEGAVLHRIATTIPAGATVTVANSTPIRDLDRYAPVRSDRIHTVGNRGASGIDGLTSTALGAGSAADGQTVAVLGDLAAIHDMNGLLALDRHDIDAVIVVINNDGGGIFHSLPIEDYDPPFTDLFRTPHDLDLAAVGDLYNLTYTRTEDVEAFETAFIDALSNDDAHLIEAATDAEESHRHRERLAEHIQDDITS